MRHLTVFAAVLAVMGTLPAAAQDRLIFGGHEIGAHGRLGQTLGHAPNFLAPGPLAGGRFVVTAYNYAVDLVTQEQVPFPGHLVLAVDPARPALFLGVATRGFFPTEVTRYDLVTREARVIASARDGETFMSARFAVDGETLFLRTQVGFTLGVMAVDLRLGSWRDVPAPRTPENVFEWAVTPDGRRIFIGGDGVVAYDAATGAERARYAGHSGAVRWLDAVDRLLIMEQDDPVSTFVILDRDLREERQAQIPRRGGCWYPRVEVSPHTLRAYVLSGYGEKYGFSDPQLSVFDWPTGTLLDETFQVPAAASCAELILVTAPGAPRGLAVTAQGRGLRAEWQNVGGASGFVLDVGLAPGRTDVSLTLGPDSHATFAEVPPGTYFLRLRGGNAVGGGRASSELRVTVP